MNHHILVVDDDPSLCDFIAYFLNRHGFQVTTVLDGSAAVRVLDEKSVHLVILDVILQDCNGLDLLFKIKQTHPRLPVLMLTGMGYHEEVLQEARKNGASGYLSKNLAKEHLLLEVRRLLNPASPADSPVP